MSGELNVRTDDLRTHAGRTHGVGDSIASAARLGGGVEMGGETFGIIGGFFAEGARAAVENAATAIDGLSVDIHGIAGAVGATAEAYDRTEDDITVLFGGGTQ